MEFSRAVVWNDDEDYIDVGMTLNLVLDYFGKVL